MVTRFFGDTNFKIKIKRGVNMERFKRFWLVASSLMLVLAMVTVLGTKPVHALVAAMVQVVNTAANPIPVTGAVRDLDNPARSPFHFRCTDVIPANFYRHECVFTVPDGQRFVIENIRGEINVPTGQKVLVSMSSNSVAGGAEHTERTALPLALQGTYDIGDIYALNQLTRIYLDHKFSNDGIISIFRTPPVDNAGFDVSVSGYLVSLP